jgi:hypothetical protein
MAQMCPVWDGIEDALDAGVGCVGWAGNGDEALVDQVRCVASGSQAKTISVGKP